MKKSHYNVTCVKKYTFPMQRLNIDINYTEMRSYTVCFLYQQ